MTSYILCCLLFTEVLLGSFHVIKSQSTPMTSEATSSVASMASTDKVATVASVSLASTFKPGSSSLMPDSSSSPTTTNQSIVMTSVSPTASSPNTVTSSEDGIHNSSTAAASPTNSSSSSTTSPNSEATKQSASSTALSGTTNFTVPAKSSQNDTGVTTTSSDASPNATVLSFTTMAAVNTNVTASSNGSSHTPTHVSITTSSVIAQTNISTAHSTVAAGNNSIATTASSISHQTVNGTATNRDAVISTTHSASTTTAAAWSTNATFTAGQNMTTLDLVTSTETSNNTWFATESVTVDTVSPSISTVTSYSSTDAVSFPSTDNYSTTGGPVGGKESTVVQSLGWVAAPVIVGILLIVAITVIVLLLLRRRQKKQRTSKFLSLERRQKDQPGGIMNPSFRIDSDDTERAPPAPVRVEDFVNHVAQLRRDSDYGFASEFTMLGKMSPQNSKSAAELPENRTKNRFTNILPFDHSRVKLIPADDDENGGSDYINASFLPGFSSRREFIAAQGPMKSTVDDFWRMIWEYNVTTLVMVTNLFERGREKCVQYWPEQNEPIYYGDIQVELKSESSLNYYIIRVLNVTLEQKSRRVMHYQFLTWPDFGVPKEHSHLLSFLTQVRSSLHPTTTNHPVLVHCSAGVGRTGTFILIDHVLQLIRRNSDIDLFGLVLDMRNYRSHMIQTEAQYIFAHECIRYAIELGYHQGRDIVTSSDDASTGETQNESVYMNSGQGSN